jgi:hypothetical protein
MWCAEVYAASLYEICEAHIYDQMALVSSRRFISLMVYRIETLLLIFLLTY